ncbi:MAG: hypothetical protein ACYTAN_13040, partial [Planctomycetota bacterium]
PSEACGWDIRSPPEIREDATNKQIANSKGSPAGRQLHSSASDAARAALCLDPRVGDLNDVDAILVDIVKRLGRWMPKCAGWGLVMRPVM